VHLKADISQATRNQKVKKWGGGTKKLICSEVPVNSPGSPHEKEEKEEKEAMEERNCAKRF